MDTLGNYRIPRNFPRRPPRLLRTVLQSKKALSGLLAAAGIKIKRKPKKPKKQSVGAAVSRSTSQKQKRRLKNLERKVGLDEGRLRYKLRDRFDQQVAVSLQGDIDLINWKVADIEACLAQARIFNPSSPGTLIQTNLATPTFSKKVFFTNTLLHIRMRNNYQVPIRITVYDCRVKKDTDTTVAGAWGSDITDMVVPSGGASSRLLKPTEGKIVRSLWKIKKLRRKLLMPGQEMVCKMRIKPFFYNNSTVDTIGTYFQKQLNSATMYCVYEGVLGHDTSADEQQSMQAGFDVERTWYTTMYYDAGANLDLIYQSDAGANDFTNVGVTSARPVVDNQSYAVA